jgi:hypothetical protein
MVSSTDVTDYKDILARFPGPITLVPSREKWWSLTVLAAFFTFLSALMLTLLSPAVGFRGDMILMLGIALCGFGTVIGVFMLLPGGVSLRLDLDGFEITRFFHKQRFNWNEVSDFDIWIFKDDGLVLFKAAKSRLSGFEKLNAALSGGRNGYLPDTYGLVAEDLLRIMKTWQNLATNATKSVLRS